MLLMLSRPSASHCLISRASTPSTFEAGQPRHLCCCCLCAHRGCVTLCGLQEESAAVTLAVDTVARVVRLIWPHARTVLFGSQATTLALPGSDLDIVVLGVTQDLARAGTGFTK